MADDDEDESARRQRYQERERVRDQVYLELVASVRALDRGVIGAGHRVVEAARKLVPVLMETAPPDVEAKLAAWERQRSG